MFWNTTEIINDLSSLPAVRELFPNYRVEIAGTFEDHISDSLTVILDDQADDEALTEHTQIFITGVTEDYIDNPLTQDFPFVALRDNGYSNGGMQTTRKEVALAFVEVRQYFVDRDAAIIATVDERF